MPVEKEIRRKKKLTLITRSDGVVLYRAKGMGREIIIIEGGSPTAVAAAFKAFLKALKKVLSAHAEPMINLIGLYGEDRVPGHGSRGKLIPWIRVWLQSLIDIAICIRGETGAAARS
jgi:hypothetical protein